MSPRLPGLPRHLPSAVLPVLNLGFDGSNIAIPKLGGTSELGLSTMARSPASVLHFLVCPLDFASASL